MRARLSCRYNDSSIIRYRTKGSRWTKRVHWELTELALCLPEKYVSYVTAGCECAVRFDVNPKRKDKESATSQLFHLPRASVSSRPEHIAPRLGGDMQCASSLFAMTPQTMSPVLAGLTDLQSSRALDV